MVIIDILRGLGQRDTRQSGLDGSNLWTVSENTFILNDTPRAKFGWSLKQTLSFSQFVSKRTRSRLPNTFNFSNYILNKRVFKVSNTLNFYQGVKRTVGLPAKSLLIFTDSFYLVTKKFFLKEIFGIYDFVQITLIGFTIIKQPVFSRLIFRESRLLSLRTFIKSTFNIYDFVSYVLSGSPKSQSVINFYSFVINNFFRSLSSTLLFIDTAFLSILAFSHNIKELFRFTENVVVKKPYTRGSSKVVFGDSVNYIARRKQYHGKAIIRQKR